MSNSVRSSGGRTTRHNGAPTSSRRRRISTSTRCSTTRLPISSRYACRTRATTTPHDASSRPGSRYSSRSHWSSTSRRPTFSLPRRPRGSCSSRSTSTTATHGPCRWPRDAIASGALGPISFATWRFGGEPGTSGHRHANLIETQCHGFDMLEHLCGPIASVSAHMHDPSGRLPDHGRVRSRSCRGRWVHSSGRTTRPTPTPRRTTSRSTDRSDASRSSTQSSGSRTRSPATRHGEVWEAGYFNDRDRDFDHMFELHLDELLAALRDGRRTTDPCPRRATRPAPRRCLHPFVRRRSPGDRVSNAP